MAELHYKLKIGSYGEGDITVQPLEANANDTYVAPEGVAYSPVKVNVPQIELTDTTITQNSTVTAPDGKGYKTVTTDVRPNLQNKVATQNGTVRADEGYDGLEEVDVQVPAPEVVLQSKTVTPSKESQTVSADLGYTALETVEVEPIPSEYILASDVEMALSMI